jgi:hypothetical protein
MEIGHYATVSRKPRSDEPDRLSSFALVAAGCALNIDVDAYIGTVGVIIAVAGVPIVHRGNLVVVKYASVKHWDLTTGVYPTYCLALYQGAITFGGCCSCKTETLIARGCRCGAFAREKVKK